MDVVARLARSSDAGVLESLEAEARLSLADSAAAPSGWPGVRRPTRRSGHGGRTMLSGTSSSARSTNRGRVRVAGTKQDVATVTHLYVHPEARDVGIGEAMIEDC